MNAQTFLTASNVIVLVGTVLVAAGAFGSYYFRAQVDEERIVREDRRRADEVASALFKEREAQKAKEEERKRVEENARLEREKRRREAVLARIHALYISSHDGISPEVSSRTAPLPKAWVEEQLKKPGESWTQDQYF